MGAAAYAACWPRFTCRIRRYRCRPRAAFDLKGIETDNERPPACLSFPAIPARSRDIPVAARPGEPAYLRFAAAYRRFYGALARARIHNVCVEICAVEPCNLVKHLEGGHVGDA